MQRYYFLFYYTKYFYSQISVTKTVTNTQYNKIVYIYNTYNLLYFILFYHLPFTSFYHQMNIYTQSVYTYSLFINTLSTKKPFTYIHSTLTQLSQQTQVISTINPINNSLIEFITTLIKQKDRRYTLRSKY